MKRPPRQEPSAPPRALEPTEEERALFLAAMEGVKRLDGPARVPVGRRRHAHASLRPATGPRGTPVVFDDDAAPRIEVERLGEVVLGRALDVDRKLVKQLKQGQPPPQTSLDLHGRTAAAAVDVLDRFVTGAVSAGRLCVLVVHGRGHHSSGDGPILKNAVITALCALPLARLVLAFASAPRELGGEGALLVRLRRPRA